MGLKITSLAYYSASIHAHCQPLLSLWHELSPWGKKQGFLLAVLVDREDIGQDACHFLAFQNSSMRESLRREAGWLEVLFIRGLEHICPS